MKFLSRLFARVFPSSRVRELEAHVAALRQLSVAQQEELNRLRNQLAAHRRIAFHRATEKR